MARKPAIEQGDTLNRIRQEAFRMFGRFGYDGVSMLNVANAAGITKAALYWHFQNKEALFLDCQSLLHEIFSQHVVLSMRDQATTSEQLKQMFYGVVDLLRDPRIRSGVAGYWLSSGSLNTDAAIKAHRQFDQASIEIMRQIMQKALDEGVLKTDIPAHDMARTAIAIWEGIVVPLRVEPFEVVEHMILTIGKTYFRAHGAADIGEELKPRYAAASAA